jgi:peptidoglycan/xylan/chitin deacetylase (PgdA/CDA1 family)
MAKRIVNLLVSLVVGIADWCRDRLGRLVGLGPRRTCTVLAYHSVTSGERAQFSRQMDVLRKAATSIPADIGGLPSAGGHYVAVTFDDGFANIAENAVPELQKRGIHSALFIVTEALGTNRAWEHYGGDDTRQEKVMSVAQLRALPADLITIGSHTMTHPMLTKIDGSKLRRELDGSRSALEKIVNRKVTLLSFPYGAFNDSVLLASREANYERVFTALPAFAFQQPGEFVTGRVGTAPTDWPIEFRLKLAGAYRWLPSAFALKRRVLSTIRGRGGNPATVKTVEKTIA